MRYLPQEIIRKKRDGHSLSGEEISDFIGGVSNGQFSDSQTAAMAMSIFLNGMDKNETIALTLAMRDSGDVLDWPDIDEPIVDKHSTGGVGDNVSLMLAPIVAACGLCVPMISGRGLGHTGGTLDKLEAIENYNATPDNALFRHVVKQAGCAIISATSNLAPADKIIYGIRDVTATVESIPLIVASILSKKLASGLQSLVLDVKCGNGATTSNSNEARVLAQTLCDVAAGAGLPATALITDMNEPLANSVGNAVEVTHAIEFLKGNHQKTRLFSVVLELAANMIFAGRITETLEAARAKAIDNLNNGRAAEHFSKMVAGLGGPTDIIDNSQKYLPAASQNRAILAQRDGWIYGYETRELGQAIVELGGGRQHPSDQIDYKVGLTNLCPIGRKIKTGDEIAIAHINSDDQFDFISERLSSIVTISEAAPDACEPILGQITASM